MNPNDLGTIAGFLRENDDYALVCHENPDGDSLGAMFALYLALGKLGKRVQAACVDPAPHKYRCIAGVETLITPDEYVPFTNLVFIDCADIRRAKLPEAIMARAQTVLNIDHHSSNNGYGDYALLSSEAAAAGVLVYDLIRAMGVEITPAIAHNLLIAISSDTGHFAHANTDAKALRTASELVELGASISAIACDMFQTKTLDWVLLLGRAIASMELHCGGQVALMHLTNRDFDELGASAADAEGIIDLARNIDSVKVAALLRESGEGLLKVSLRSKDTFDVSVVAMHFAGGGHMRAAGYSIAAPYEQARTSLIARLSALCADA